MRKYRCCVEGCSSKSGDEGISLHSFPSSPTEFQEWKKRCGVVDSRKCLFVCSRHFSKTDFRSCNFRRILISGIPPHLNLQKDFGHPITKINITSRVVRVANQLSIKSPEQHPFKTESEVMAKVTELPSLASPSSIGNPEDDFPMVNDGSSTSSTSHPQPTLVQDLNVTSKELIPPIESSKSCNKTQGFGDSEEALVTKNKSKDDDCFLEKNNSPVSYEMVMKELANRKNAGKGILWTKQEKAIGVSLYKTAPQLYSTLSRMFFLPTVPNFNKNISQAKELNKKQNLNELESSRLCVLTFHEVKLKPQLEYDEKRDQIVGYEDLGNGEFSYKIATHALVFVALGINEHWTLPVAYYFIHKTTPPIILKTLILNAINFLSDENITVVATICDRSVSNMAAVDSLVSGVEKPMFGKTPVYFRFENSLKNWKIFTIYNPPHLLKWTRDLLIQHDIQFNLYNNKRIGIASWAHIRNFYNDDIKTSPVKLRLAPNLTASHVNPTLEQKKSIQSVSETFSYPVVAGIMARVASNILPLTHFDTAHFVSQFHNLFDSLNGSNRDPENAQKLYKTSIHQNSKHENLFKELLPCLESWQFLGAESSTCWLVTIQAVWGLWECLRDEHNHQQLPTSQLNLNVLENLYDIMCQHCDGDSVPTVGQFVGALKASMGRLISTPTPTNPNTMESKLSKLINLDSNIFNSSKNKTCDWNKNSISTKQKSADKEDFIMPGLQFSDPFCSSFMAGYFHKKLLPSVKHCMLCVNELTFRPNKLPEEFSTSVNQALDGKCVVYASDHAIKSIMAVEIIYNPDQVRKILNQSLFRRNVVHKLVTCMKNKIDFSWLTCASHRNDIIKELLSSAVESLVRSWCNKYNTVDFDNLNFSSCPLKNYKESGKANEIRSPR